MANLAFLNWESVRHKSEADINIDEARRTEFAKQEIVNAIAVTGRSISGLAIEPVS